MTYVFVTEYQVSQDLLILGDLKSTHDLLKTCLYPQVGLQLHNLGRQRIEHNASKIGYIDYQKS